MQEIVSTIQRAAFSLTAFSYKELTSTNGGQTLPTVVPRLTSAFASLTAPLENIGMEMKATKSAPHVSAECFRTNASSLHVNHVTLVSTVVLVLDRTAATMLTAAQLERSEAKHKTASATGVILASTTTKQDKIIVKATVLQECI